MVIPVPCPDLSVVIPVYKNMDMILELHERICRVLELTGIQFEIVFIDDDCPQGSLIALKHIAEKDVRTNILVMARNVGQQNALLAGIGVADGRSVLIMDADLQDPPEAVPLLLKELNNGHDVVFAGRRGKYEEGSRLLSSRIYKWILHLLIGVPQDAGLFLLMEKTLAKKLPAMNVAYPNLVAMIATQARNSTSIPVERNKRPSGNSAYTNWMRLRVGVLTVFWAIGWQLGLRPGLRLKSPDFQIKERIGSKFNSETGVFHG
jgi:glycosyltransferase involved in cell wall biosynthesis